MKIIRLHQDVYEINEFLTSEELDAVYTIIKNTKEEDWFSEETAKDKDFSNFWDGKNIEFKKETVFDSIRDKMESLFESYSDHPGKILLQRYKEGDFIQLHRDQWNPELPYYIGYGLCLYYNDEYDGGQLEYPEIGLIVKPKANSLYIHGGTVLHGSTPVIGQNIRYFSTAFVRGTEEKPTRLKKELFK
jgi:hypothetical protein